MAHKKEGKERISDPRVDRIWEYMREKKINLTKLSKVSGLSYLHGSWGQVGHGDRYIGSLFRVDEPAPDDSHAKL